MQVYNDVGALLPLRLGNNDDDDCRLYRWKLKSLQ